MNKNTNNTAFSTDRNLVITRIFDAPPKAVWEAWTESKRLMRWWGPKDFTCPIGKIDLRIGGKYLFCMRSREGQKFWSTGTFKELTPFERIAFTDSFADEKGNIVPASHYGMQGDDFPLELSVLISFENLGTKTKMTLCHVGLPPGEMEEMCGVSWNESFDKLTEYLSELMQNDTDHDVKRAEE